MSTVVKRIGPSDHGRRMRLADFEHVDVEPGFLYELGRGRIVVSDVPGEIHFGQVHTLRVQLDVYCAANPEVIYRVGSGSECKLLTQAFESERHPDLAVYKVPAPEVEGEDVWGMWIPELVIEVVSASSRSRDYNEKPDEYLAIGVHEYWIVDAKKQILTAKRRIAGEWRDRVVKPSERYRTPLLPGFELDLASIFAAGSGKRRGKR
jgi:Uma2 family endonuclease